MEEQPGDGGEAADDQGNLEVDDEGLGEAAVGERAGVWQLRSDGGVDVGLHDPGEELFVEEPGDADAEGRAEQRMLEPLLQFEEVLEQRTLDGAGGLGGHASPAVSELPAGL